MTEDELYILNDECNIKFEDKRWYVLCHIEKDSYEGEIFYKVNKNIIPELIREDLEVYLLFIFISILCSMAILSNQIKNDQIKYFSKYDDMTGVYNRRKGIDKLNKLYQENIKNNKILSVCFIDINGLKLVNDTLGNEAGDELISSISNVLKENISENDFIIRLGGDEFLVIFDNIDDVRSENIFKNIVKEYENVNNNESRKYLISVSHGIGMIDVNSNKNIDEVIDYADKKMYEEKRKIKRNINIIRNQ